MKCAVLLNHQKKTKKKDAWVKPSAPPPSPRRRSRRLKAQGALTDDEPRLSGAPCGVRFARSLARPGARAEVCWAALLVISRPSLTPRTHHALVACSL